MGFEMATSRPRVANPGGGAGDSPSGGARAAATEAIPAYDKVRFQSVCFDCKFGDFAKRKNSAGRCRGRSKHAGPDWVCGALAACRRAAPRRPCPPGPCTTSRVSRTPAQPFHLLHHPQADDPRAAPSGRPLRCLEQNAHERQPPRKVRRRCLRPEEGGSQRSRRTRERRGGRERGRYAAAPRSPRTPATQHSVMPRQPADGQFKLAQKQASMRAAMAMMDLAVRQSC